MHATHDTVIDIAQRAGEAIMAIYRNPQDTDAKQKADLSPLTAADLAAHQCITTALATLTPDIPVVSEESENGEPIRTQAQRFWLVDPLDGTKEFLTRNGEFTVNIALIEHGYPTWGVVHAPVLGQTFWGGLGQGAQLREAHGEQRRLHITPQAPEGTLRVVASKSHLDDDTRAFIAQLGDVRTVQVGSSLKLCQIAAGQADVYPRFAPTCEWDTAAAQAVVEGAGGHVFDRQGQRLRCGKPDVLNPHFIVSRWPLAELQARWQA